MSKIKKLLSSQNILIPGIYDGLTAKIVEQNHFKVAWISGFSVSASMGLPDDNTISINDYITRIKEITRVSNLSFLVDCDEGFGNIDNTLFLLERIIELGIEAVCIEDNTFPKVNSFKNVNGSRTLLSINDFSEKLKKIKSSFPKLLVVARTEALIAGYDLQEAIKRGYYFEDAGADVILIHSKYESFNEYKNLISNWKSTTPLAVVPTNAHSLTFNDFQTLGYKIVIFANQILRRSIFSIETSTHRMSENVSIKDVIGEGVTMEHVFKITDNFYKNSILYK